MGLFHPLKRGGDKTQPGGLNPEMRGLEGLGIGIINERHGVYFFFTPV